MKLGLGAAQFGMKYGISNPGGAPAPEEVASILREAATAGIRHIDTATLYQASEETLGRNLPTGDFFSIITKTTKAANADTITPDDVTRLESTFHESLRKLRKDSVYGLLLHDAGDLAKGRAQLLVEQLQRLKAAGLVKKIGVSVYDSVQIDAVLEMFRPDIVQLPISVLDQRLLRSGHLEKLAKAGIEVHARSIFLQGLLLMEPDRIPPPLASVRPHLAELRSKLSAMHSSPLEAALAFVIQRPEITCALVGVQSSAELRQILDAAARAKTLALNFEEIAWDDEDIINPTRWKKLGALPPG